MHDVFYKSTIIYRSHLQKNELDCRFYGYDNDAYHRTNLTVIITNRVLNTRVIFFVQL